MSTENVRLAVEAFKEMNLAKLRAYYAEHKHTVLIKRLTSEELKEYMKEEEKLAEDFEK